MRRGKNGPLTIAGIYLLLGGSWILFSDQLTSVLARDLAGFLRISLVKGWIYVMATAVLLYWLVNRQMKALRSSEDELKQMNEALMANGEEIRRLNGVLEQRVAERTAQLEAACKELESFSYSVSHDLRAPLRHIDGFSKALLEDCGDKLGQDGKNYVQRLRFATQRMGRLIDDMLKLANVSSCDLNRQQVNLSRMAHTIALELRQTQPQRRVEFVIAEDIVANGDARLLRVVLANLLGNAWKYTGKRERAIIEFGVAEIDGERACYVCDNGAGFDMAYADKIFGAFQRLHSAEEFEGSGIGLATVQRIIRRHGGRVRAEGKVGKGAIFYFTLPSGRGRQRPDRAENSMEHLQ